MNEATILKKAIEKAVKNGYKEGEMLLELMDDKNYTYSVKAQSIIIFSHNFAKAFWKDEESPKLCAGNHLGERWQYHLQELVLEEEPLKYLEEFFIKKNEEQF